LVRGRRADAEPKLRPREPEFREIVGVVSFIALGSQRCRRTEQRLHGLSRGVAVKRSAQPPEWSGLIELVRLIGSRHVKCRNIADGELPNLQRSKSERWLIDRVAHGRADREYLRRVGQLGV